VHPSTLGKVLRPSAKLRGWREAMAGQGIERREVLRILSIAAVAARFTGFVRWTFACEHVSADSTQIRSATYAPQFFSASEYRAVERLTEMIVPSDGGAGAREAGVSEFVDFMVWSDPTLQYKFRFGLGWLDAHSERLYSKPFIELEPGQQNLILRRLAYKKEFCDGEEDGRVFFALMREYTLMGFYTSRVGLEELDYPGLRFYSESPSCPHVNDREHVHLPPPKY
jgi:gluconate 2-dehydrogenase gamma chain